MKRKRLKLILLGLFLVSFSKGQHVGPYETTVIYLPQGFIIETLSVSGVNNYQIHHNFSSQAQLGLSFYIK